MSIIARLKITIITIIVNTYTVVLHISPNISVQECTCICKSLVDDFMLFVLYLKESNIHDYCDFFLLQQPQKLQLHYTQHNHKLIATHIIHDILRT